MYRNNTDLKELWIVAIFLKELIKIALNRYSNRTYSQEGEDLLLGRLFEGKPPGFFVDVGAHHPVRFSNTYRLYRSGWRGLCIDANPVNMRLFEKIRPRDICVTTGVSDTAGYMTYYEFNDGALNTFSQSRAMELKEHTPFQLTRKTEVPVARLEDLLIRHVPEGLPIDLLSVDIEGFDYQVLASNNWERHAPRVIVVEDHEMNLEEPFKSRIHTLLRSKGYSLYSKLYASSVYLRIGSTT